MSELEEVLYGYVEDKNFVGPDNKKAVIAELLKSSEIGFDKKGFLCKKCGFVYMDKHSGCHICNPETQENCLVMSCINEKHRRKP